MKLIEALLPHGLVQTIQQSLTALGIDGLSLTSVYRPMLGTSQQNFGNPFCKLEVMVPDDEVDRAQAALVEIAGIPSRMQIFVRNIEQTIRIRTGESQESAV